MNLTLKELAELVAINSNIEPRKRPDIDRVLANIASGLDKTSWLPDELKTYDELRAEEELALQHWWQQQDDDDMWVDQW